MLDKRKTEVYVDDTWVETIFSKLRKGDIYRLYKENSIDLVEDNLGNSTFKALCDASFDGDGGFNFKLDCEPYIIK